MSLRPLSFITLLPNLPYHRRLSVKPLTTCSNKQPNKGVAAVVASTRHRHYFQEAPATTPIPIHLVPKPEWPAYLDRQSTSTRNWLEALGPPTTPIPVPSSSSEPAISHLVVPIKPGPHQLWRLAAALASLPNGLHFRIDESAGFSAVQLELAWAFTTYVYTAYKTPEETQSSILTRLTDPDSPERADVDRIATATYMVRDMITTPAEHFGPSNLEAAVSTLAAQHAARSSAIIGDQLIHMGYPQVHCVGRATTAERAPRLLELSWNDTAQLGLTLVGKGVCYDTGGLSIKPTNSMVTMKKDMAGAAQVLGLAHMIMDARLDVRLRVLIPAVENAIDSSSFRPGDVLTARNGTTTLNINSDAEGRLVLADALVAATEDDPDLIIDCATLTGAQRVALGTDVPSIFCNDDDIADRLVKISRDVEDLVWPLPLYEPYRKLLDTPIADIKSCSNGGYGGAITAALYLKEFVGDTPWIHVDMMGYNTTSSPGRPEGGEAMGMRAIFEFLRERYATQ